MGPNFGDMGIGKESKEKPDPSEFSLLNSSNSDLSLEDDILAPTRPRNHRWYQRGMLLGAAAWLAIFVLATTVAVQSVQLARSKKAVTAIEEVAAKAAAAAVVADTRLRTADAPVEPGLSGRCGSNATEAMEAGCVFDYMNNSWQPPECYYPELDREHRRMMYERWGKVRWWADIELKQELPDDPEVLKWYGDLYVERKFHYAHCLYGWALLHKSYNDRAPLADLTRYNHTVHCSQVLNKAIQEADGTGTRIEHDVTYFSQCVWPNKEPA